MRSVYVVVLDRGDGQEVELCACATLDRARSVRDRLKLVGVRLGDLSVNDPQIFISDVPLLSFEWHEAEFVREVGCM